MKVQYIYSIRLHYPTKDNAKYYVEVLQKRKRRFFNWLVRYKRMNIRECDSYHEMSYYAFNRQVQYVVPDHRITFINLPERRE